MSEVGVTERTEDFGGGLWSFGPLICAFRAGGDQAPLGYAPAGMTGDRGCGQPDHHDEEEVLSTKGHEVTRRGGVEGRWEGFRQMGSGRKSDIDLGIGGVLAR